MTKDNAEGRVKLDRLTDLVASEFRAQGEQIARVEGQLSTVIQWMQSMDQRFTALMRPYEPPKDTMKAG